MNLTGRGKGGSGMAGIEKAFGQKWEMRFNRLLTCATHVRVVYPYARDATATPDILFRTDGHL